MTLVSNQMHSTNYGAFNLRMHKNHEAIPKIDVVKCESQFVGASPKNIFSTREQSINAAETSNEQLWKKKSREEKFIKHPSYKAFKKLSKKFLNNYERLDTDQFYWMGDFLIHPHECALKEKIFSKNFRDHEKWISQRECRLKSEGLKAENQRLRRRKKISEKGLGIGGSASVVAYRMKQAGTFGKDNLTLRGNVQKLANKICGFSLFELLPRYRDRKAAHIAVRVSEFSTNAFLTAAGHGLIPVSFGISKIVSDHARTVVTLSGDALSNKFAGASNQKTVTHAALRGVQLEVPKFIPTVGDYIQYTEMGMQGVSMGAIVSGYLADIFLSRLSDRYKKTLSKNDLGDPRCLFELKQRIDYLSRFLIPYGQFLLFHEPNMKKRDEYRTMLKKQSKILRKLERRRIKAQQFYELALIAEKIPKDHQQEIRQALNHALDSPRKNTHRIARRCLATLLART